MSLIVRLLHPSATSKVFLTFSAAGMQDAGICKPIERSLLIHASEIQAVNYRSSSIKRPSLTGQSS